tara:strand:- start:654 stop:1202 length:549 start_codon:yes stop_codon:yes gene_type:complete
MYSEVFIAWIIGIVLIWLFVKTFKFISKREQKRLFALFSVSFTAILVFGTISYATRSDEDKKKYKHWYQYINNYEGPIFSLTFLKMVLIGFVTGVVFGIIDNTGLWFGMESLDPILPKGTLTRAGYGNVYADTLSAFLSTFAGKTIANLVKINDTPLWADAIGTTCGCLVGLHACKSITGRQ